ncbi:hypothetical protein, conserved [Leishmania tarentolae]|uniref:Uncharacterized protein n=1 Tax=Leishmania tarentolae TaxID=5689 RepID=A0A640KN83_LEITA|nr:hypothetical protein, conserved [Leishmania tarentolae]GET91059.1 hypothetical protein, conserved [Leishmania tarentolae]
MDAAGAQEDSSTIPLQLDIDYVDASRDACFSWLQRKYASIKPVVETSSSDPKGGRRRIDAALLQRLENDVVACDELRWRAFSFPSHPIHPLNVNYRHDANRKAGTPATAVEIHRTKQHSASSTEHTTNGTKDSYTLVIRTRADSEARRSAKKERRKAKSRSAAAVEDAIGVPTLRVEDLLENAVRKEKQAYWCRLLGEENIGRETLGTSSWADRWIPRSWRPLLGGYVSAPSRMDHARFLIFPQSAHPVVDMRDPKALSSAPGNSLESPQSVPYYVRGSASWEVEESNPAAGGAVPARATGEESTRESAPRGGLRHSLAYARITPAVAQKHCNWVDAVEVSVAHQQPRTERQYAPERAKVQRVTVLEDSVAVKTSRGNPRHSTLISAARATVLRSGIAHQRAGPDDALLQLRVEDVYESSVQHFSLPGIWRRWIRPAATTAFTSESEGVTGSHSLADAPRGLYRMRWAGGPGVELCQIQGCTDATESTKSESAQACFLTIFGKLWTESWVQLPMFSRWTLTLRNQSAVVVPLEASAAVAPQVAVKAGTFSEPTATTSSSTEASSSWRERVCTHPYFWATQGPRWDAALVRGFKNDYNGLHHARRWYSLISVELSLGGGMQTGNSARVKRSGRTAAERNDSTGGCRENGAGINGGNVEDSTPPAGSGWKGTSLTAFVNACMVDSVRDYPRASVGFSFISKIPRLAITPFNEIVPRKFECSLSWFAAFTPRTGEAASGNNVNGRTGVGLELQSGLSKASSSAAEPTTAADGMPLLRVSPVETFQHLKCGLTWRFDD